MFLLLSLFRSKQKLVLLLIHIGQLVCQILTLPLKDVSLLRYFSKFLSKALPHLLTCVLFPIEKGLYSTQALFHFFGIVRSKVTHRWNLIH